ncbi:MAG: DUF1275 domain-containing protein [Bdellovibrio sp. CG10_big_fil_rev_8_21_14_0_10_47_8]|nr:MAG: DUF1275 domain-containing protein [Bdellovibrio sp. CG10_big_fil_rev_8_21_14_0_10_47_8]
MFSGSQNLSHFTSKNMAIWLSMAFQGGAINAGGFLACHRFVSHTTGFATYFGTEFSQGHWNAALGMLTVPLFFLLGAAISGFFVDRRLVLHQRPLYTWMFAFISFAMLFISFFGELGSFGTFGEPMEISQDYGMLALLCLCSGIQNGTITSASGAVVRTTHMTGITTDLGLGLVRVFAIGQSKQTKVAEARANGMRTGLIVSFLLGSTVSSYLFFHIQYLGFLMPCLISFLLTVVAFRTSDNTSGGSSYA